MIRFENLNTDFLDIPFYEIKKGFVYKIVFHSDFEKNEFLDVLLGIKKPKSGRIFLFNEDIFDVSEKVYYNILKRLGLIWENGGIISNLKVWENIALPVWFHNNEKPESLEQKVISLYDEIGMFPSRLSEYMGRLPGSLPAFDKRFICLVRSMLMEPELMIYDGIFVGLKGNLVERLKNITERFHRELPGRTSMYLASNEQYLQGLYADYTILPEEKGFKIWRS